MSLMKGAYHASHYLTCLIVRRPLGSIAAIAYWSPHSMDGTSRARKMSHALESFAREP